MCRRKPAEKTEGTDLTCDEANTMQWTEWCSGQRTRGLCWGAAKGSLPQAAPVSPREPCSRRTRSGEHLQHAVLQRPAEATSASLDEVSRHDTRARSECRFSVFKIAQKSIQAYVWRYLLCLHKFFCSAKCKHSPSFVCHVRNYL